MKIKRFFSQDMRSVIRMVREELGPDAVILSNNRVSGGVEIIAAVDYDESLLSNNAASLTKSTSQQANQETLSEDSDSNSASREASQSELIPPIRHDKNPFGEPKLSRSRHFDLEQPGVLTAEDLGLPANPSDRPQVIKAEPKQSPSDKSFISLDGDGTESKEQSSAKVDYFRSEQYQQQAEEQFYRLDNTSPDSNRVSDSLYATPPASRDNRANKAANVWSQEPTLVEMRNEIVTLRGLLEQQLTGLAWGETERRNPIRAKLIRQLLELDLSSGISKQIADMVDEDSDYPNAWQNALTYLTDSVPIADEDLIVSGGVVALIGATGVGKTTSVAKLASRYALRYGRNNIGLITIDNYRVGAHEQLKTYARIFDIPMRVATNKESLIECINAMSDKQLVLIDTAGMSHKDKRLANQFNILKDCTPNLKTLLVLPSTSHRMVLDETIRVFSQVKLDGCIATKVDETSNLGGTLSVLIKHKLPIMYFCDGQKMPEALHIASAHALVNRSVLIARKTNQPLGKESVELAFTGQHGHAHI